MVTIGMWIGLRVHHVRIVRTSALFVSVALLVIGRTSRKVSTFRLVCSSPHQETIEMRDVRSLYMVAWDPVPWGSSVIGAHWGVRGSDVWKGFLIGAHWSV